MSTLSTYYTDARNDARRTVREFQEEILEQLMERGEASIDLQTDYSNGECWRDQWDGDCYTLREAADLLEELPAHQEDDEELWEGLYDPSDAVSCQAAHTYGNAIFEEWCSLIDEINDKAKTIIEDYAVHLSNVEKADGSCTLSVTQLLERKESTLEAIIQVAFLIVESESK